MRNIGKISKTVLDRSVIKLQKQYKVYDKGASTQLDCALFSDIGMATGYVAFKDQKCCEHAIIQACNNLFASGVIPNTISISISMPDSYREIRLKDITRQACETADALGITISGGHTEFVKDLKEPIISVTALGDPDSEYQGKEKKGTNMDGYDIVMTKWMGLSGTSIIATEKKDELITRLPAYYIEDARGLGAFISIKTEAMTAMKDENTVSMHDVAGGGLFAALWEICSYLKCGCRINLKDIPIRQETVEVCEFFDINPYRLKGDGSLLIVTKTGDSLAKSLINNGVLATVIGHTSQCIDRVILRDEEVRYLESADTDEIHKVL